MDTGSLVGSEILQFPVQPSHCQRQGSQTDRDVLLKKMPKEILSFWTRDTSWAMWQGVAGYRTGPGPGERQATRVQCSGGIVQQEASRTAAVTTRLCLLHTLSSHLHLVNGHCLNLMEQLVQKIHTLQYTARKYKD